MNPTVETRPDAGADEEAAASGKEDNRWQR